MRICLFSDLHLDHHFDGGEEFISQLVIPDCDLTVVAGDLSQANHWRWKQNVKEICDKSKQVLYVLGNHCYYQSTLVEVDCLAHGLAESFPNLIVASRAKVLTEENIQSLGNLSLLAGTFWFPDNYDQARYKGLLNDFNYIENIEPEIYRRNKRFDILLHDIKDEPCIVVSHHLPSSRSVSPKYAGNALNRFFVGGEFQELIQDSKIIFWGHGHAHDAVDYKIGNTRIASRPFGYPTEAPCDWEPLTVDIDT